MSCEHEYYLNRGRRLTACACFCQACHSGTQCICADCSHDPEVHIDPGYYNKIEKEDREKYPDNKSCQDCGAILFRKNNRGRWPLRCPECKAK